MVDGIIGGVDDYWIGWNKSPASIEFHFDTSRQFKKIQIYTMSDKYQSVQVKFDDNFSIEHHPSPIESSLPTVFIDTILLAKYGTMFLGKRVEIIFDFENALFLTEITFDSEPAILLNATTSDLNNTSNCSIGMK